jgi:glutamate formiminotransferase/formiminotetrahydrofolate cyclodeaminase
VTVAIQSLGLSDIAPFDRNAKIIEYKIGKEENLLREQSIVALTDELASDSPAPGGGSVSALCGALSASLCAMVANLTFEKKGFADKKPQMESLANKAQRLKSFFLLAIDEDSKAFNQIVNARKLPKSTIYEQLLREHAILEANMQAIKVPLSVLTASEELLELAAMAISDGNPNSLSDAGCAVLNAQACAEGAYMNVLINVPSLIHSGQAVQCSETSESSESSKSSAGLTSSELIAFKEKTLQTAGDAIEKIRSLAKQLSGDVFDKLAALTDID